MQSTIRTVCVLALALTAWIGCGPGKPRGTLHEAAEKGDAIAVQQHIAAKANLNAPDRNGWTAMHIAARRGDVNLVQALGAAGADPGRKGPGGQTPLDVARAAGKTAVVQLLQAHVKSATGGGEKKGGTGRGLVDGGLGVSGAMEGM